MAINGDGSGKDEQKTRFSTREGVYSLMPLIEYYRPNRSNFSSTPIPLNAVHLSLVTVPGVRDYPERLCLNIGKELYIYVYKGIKSVSILLRLHLPNPWFKCSIIGDNFRFNGLGCRYGYADWEENIQDYESYMSQLQYIFYILRFNPTISWLQHWHYYSARFNPKGCL